MVEVTPKENWMMMLNGELPVHLPRYTMGFIGYNGETAVRMIGPNLFDDTHNGPQGGKDIWGVNYVANKETGFAALPEPNNFILDDIENWEKVIVAPKMPENIDWESMAKADYDKTDIDRTQSAVCSNIGFSPFQMIMGFMGFNEGLCALYEDPETVKELLAYMTDFYLPIVEKTVEYYKPDMLGMADDTATKFNPFISLETYRDIFLPIYKRLAKPATDRGIPIHFHNCGRCEDFIDDMVNFGVRSWDPAQPANDLLGIKEKYKGRLSICGGWEWELPETWPEVSEEEIRQGARDAIDKYAPGGGFAFAGSALGAYQDPIITKINDWLREEVYVYGRYYYQKH